MDEFKDFFGAVGDESELIENVAADEDIGTVVNSGFHRVKNVVEFDFDEIGWFNSAGLSDAAFAPLHKTAR